MTGLVLTKIRLHAGVWEGELTGAGATQPSLQAMLQGDTLGGLDLTRDADRDIWQVRLPIPADRISDGVQTILIVDADGRTLASIPLLAGEALADDIRAELDLLRAEFDMLKAAFRRHCSDG